MPTQLIEVRLAKSQFDSKDLQRIKIGFESTIKWVKYKQTQAVTQYAEILAGPNNDSVKLDDNIEIGYPGDKPLYSGQVRSVVPCIRTIEEQR